MNGFLRKVQQQLELCRGMVQVLLNCSRALDFISESNIPDVSEFSREWERTQ